MKAYVRDLTQNYASLKPKGRSKVFAKIGFVSLVLGMLIAATLTGCHVSKNEQQRYDPPARQSKSFTTQIVTVEDNRYQNLDGRIQVAIRNIERNGGEVISVSVFPEEDYQNRDETMFHAVIAYRTLSAMSSGSS